MARTKKKKESPRTAPPVRPFWSGVITFGLVSVPVRLFPANRRPVVSLRLLDEDGTPLRRRYYCPKHERDVHPEHIVRGYEVGPGEYVIVRDEELESLDPKKSQEIDLQRVVDANQISPMLFERSYYLTPSGNSSKAYRLLAEIMERTGRAGMATFVMRDKEYLVAILAENGILLAATMRFPDEVRNPKDMGLPEPTTSKKQQVATLEREIDKLTDNKLSLKDLKDERAQRLIQLVERKRRAGKDVVESEEAAEPDGDDGVPQSDLLESIRRSLQRGNGITVHNGRRHQPSRKKSRVAK